MTKYNHLTLDQRSAIYGLNQEGFTQRFIARQLSIHPSTVNRERHRHRVNGSDDPKSAHLLAVERRGKPRRPTILTHETVQRIRHLIRKDWSPEQISGRLKRNGELVISHETIDKYVYIDKAQVRVSSHYQPGLENRRLFRLPL